MSKLATIVFSLQGLFLFLSGLYSIIDPDTVTSEGLNYYGTPLGALHASSWVLAFVLFIALEMDC